jgi:hypothetical protein
MNVKKEVFLRQILLIFFKICQLGFESFGMV